MRNQFIRSVAFVGIAGTLAACGKPVENLKEEGFSTYQKPEVTTTCYDYAGNTILNHKANTDGLEVKAGGVVVKQDGRPSVIVTNGGGCITTEKYLDETLPANKAPYTNAANKALIFGIVTNSSDSVLFSGKFNDAAYDDSKGTVTYSLKSEKGTPLIKTTVTGGLNAIATDQLESLGESIRNALPNSQQEPK